MSHPDPEHLSLYAMGELSQTSAQKIVTHAAICLECQRLLREELAFEAEIGMVVATQQRKLPPIRSANRPFRRVLFAVGMAAAVLLGVVFWPTTSAPLPEYVLKVEGGAVQMMGSEASKKHFSVGSEMVFRLEPGVKVDPPMPDVLLFLEDGSEIPAKVDTSEWGVAEAKVPLVAEGPLAKNGEHQVWIAIGRGKPLSLSQRLELVSGGPVEGWRAYSGWVTVGP